jgi:hypothetical protein
LEKTGHLADPGGRRCLAGIDFVCVPVSAHDAEGLQCVRDDAIEDRRLSPRGNIGV